MTNKVTPSFESLFNQSFYFRYRAVCKPFSGSSSRRTANAIIILIWILSIAFAIPMAIFHQFSFSKDRIHGIKPFCTPYKPKHKVIARNETRSQNSIQNLDEEQMEPYDIYMLVLFFYQYFIPLLVSLLINVC